MRLSRALHRFLTPPLAALLVAASALPARAQQPQEEITSDTPRIVSGLRDGVMKDRAQAEIDLQRARRWRQLEAEAREYAAQSKNPKDIAHWNENAQQWAKNAAGLEADAKMLTGRADAAEKRALRLERAYAEKTAPPAPRTTSAPVKPDPEKNKPAAALALTDVLGLWATTGGTNFSIAILSKAGPGNPPTPELAAHTGKRVWEGKYTGAASGPIVSLNYTPHAEEMNSEIPEWARRALQGKLYWRIDLEAKGDETDPLLVGKWYAGEVTWDPDSHDPADVRITGDGKPWEFELEPSYGISVDALMRPMLGIRIETGEDYDPDANPPESLIQGQLFTPYVTLPADLAKSTRSITLTIKGSKGGAQETLELKPRSRPGRRPVTYMPDDAVMIADCAALAQARRNPQVGSMQWMRRSVAGERAQQGGTLWTFIAGDKPGPCLNLRVANGETLEFRAQDASMRLPIYDSWVQRGLARHKVLLNRLKVMLQATAAGSFAAATKDAARFRLRMLNNYERIVASDKITDLHRYYVGEFYFGDTAGPAIVLMSDAQFAQYYDDWMRGPREPAGPSYLNPLMKAFLEGLSGRDLTPKAGQAGAGVAWTSPKEQNLVVDMLQDTSKQIASNAVKTWVEQMTFGGYEGYVAATGANQLWLVATGTDHHGVRQSGWDRFFAAVGLASNVILSVAGAQAEEAFASASKTARLGKTAKAESTLIGRASRGVEELEKSAVIRGLPSSLSAAEREELMLRTVPGAAERAEEPIRCALRAEKSVAPSTLMEIRSVPGSGGFDPLAGFAERQRIEDYILVHWGPETKILQWSDQPLQELQGFDRLTCNAMAANRLAATQGGIVRTQSQAQKAILKIMYDQLEEWNLTGGMSTGSGARKGNRTAADLKTSPGFRSGFDNLAIRDYLRAGGATVTELKQTENARLKLRHIWSALEQGYGVKIVVDFKRRAGSVIPSMHALHAVTVESVVIGVKNGRPAVNAVRVYDSNVGRIIQVPARIFNEILARNYREGIMTLVKFEAKKP